MNAISELMVKHKLERVEDLVDRKQLPETLALTKKNDDPVPQ